MKLICVLCLGLTLLQASNGYNCPDQSDLFRRLKDDCGDYARDVKKEMLGYFDKFTQKIEQSNNESQSKNNLIWYYEEKQINHEMELKKKDELITQLENDLANLHMQIHKLKDDLLASVQSQMEKMHKLTIEQLPKNQCKKIKQQKAELERELQSQGIKLATCLSNLPTQQNN